jgi:hypothetical protein
MLGKAINTLKAFSVLSSASELFHRRDYIGSSK